jgi:hypothetical protein
MKHSRVVMLVVVIAVLLLLILPTSIALGIPLANVQVYENDFSGWQRDVGLYAMERFDDPYFGPSVSVVADDGFVRDGYWVDWVAATGPTKITTWYFSHPISAWGGLWNTALASGWDGVDVWINNGFMGSWAHVSPGTVPNTYAWNFWGLRAAAPFTAVRLTSVNGGQIYQFDNMVWNTTTYYPGFVGKGGMRPGCFGPPTSS